MKDTSEVHGKAKVISDYSREDRNKSAASNDRAIGSEFLRAINRLDEWDSGVIENINEAIELRQCALYIQNACKMSFGVFNLGNTRIEADDLLAKAEIANKAACEFANKAVNKNQLEALLDETESLHGNDFWELVVSSGAYRQIDKNGFGKMLEHNSSRLSPILESKKLVKAFGSTIRDAMLANPDRCANLIIDALARDQRGMREKTLPEELSSDDVDEIFSGYIESDKPNLNYLQVIAQWNNYGNKPISAKTVLSARRKNDVIMKKMFADDGGIQYGVAVSIDSKQKSCISISAINHDYRISYGEEWLEMYDSPAQILTNFIHIFEFITPWGNLSISEPDRGQSAIFNILGIHTADEYRTSIGFNFEQLRVLTTIGAYDDFLRRRGKSIAEAINWFFNEYLESEFEIEGFRCDLAVKDESFLSRCENIADQLERVGQCYLLYVREGEIDTGLYRIERFSDFNQIGSVLGDKYIYGVGDEYENICNLMFSDQCMLAYPKGKGRDEARCFFDLLGHVVLRMRDYEEYCYGDIDWLISQGLINADEDGEFCLTDKALLIHSLWKHGCYQIAFLGEEGLDLAKDMKEKHLIESDNHLLCEQESDYFSYILNNRKYSNALALRNKYGHGAPPLSNPNSDEHRKDYFILLSLAVELVLKINDELCTKYDTDGKIDFVDWPMYGETSADLK